ncbi:MAG: hypothetical protein RLZZ338_2945 [Cyanobacteriota bacterium]|jgi:6-pyruvoyl-tetrahydropterin synthase
MTQLIYPTVDLFLYDLRDGLGQNEVDLALNRSKFLQKIDPEFDQQFKALAALAPQDKQSKLVKYDPIASSLEKKLKEFETKENPEADFVQLYAKQFQENPGESDLDGYYYALQLADTYSLQVDASGSLENPEQPRDLSQLKENQKIIISHLNHNDNDSTLEDDKLPSLGKTWLVWGQLANNTETMEEIAKKCYQEISPNLNGKPQLQEIGELFDVQAKVFEYWNIPRNWGQNWETFSAENYHLIVILFPPTDQNTLSEMGKSMQSIYFDLTRLLCYRHKIIWAYWQSRRLKALMKLQSAKSKQMIDKVKNLPNEMEKMGIDLHKLELDLTQALPLLSDYAIDMKRLEVQLMTITTNLFNYQKRVEVIQNKRKGNLKLLQGDNCFYELAQKKYRKQVKSDLASLTPELTLLENLISTLRGIIDIENTKSEKALNVTVGIAGMALATSGVTATVLSTQIRPPQGNYKSINEALGLSMGVGFISVIICFLIVFIFRNFRHRF